MTGKQTQARIRELEMQIEQKDADISESDSEIAVMIPKLGRYSELLEQAQKRVAVLEGILGDARKRFERIHSLTDGNGGASDSEIREATDDAIYEIDTALKGGNDGQ